MPRSRQPEILVPAGGIFSTRLHLVLYSLLLIATPFLMLQNFLQEAIGNLSRFSVKPFGIEIPVLLGAAVVMTVIAIVGFRKHITRRHVMTVVVVLLMDTLSQQIADYYFNHKFYDLQHNWHYIAYGGFAFMVFRDLSWRNIPQARIILLTFCIAVLFSSFDEFVQLHISSRVFDIGDIAKDTWGCIMGLTLINIGPNRIGSILENRRPVRRSRLRDYLAHPFSLLVLLVCLAFLFLLFASILTDVSYCGHVVLLTSAAFIAFFLVFHLSRLKWWRRGFVSLLVIALAVQTTFFIKHRDDHIIHHQTGVTVYKGFPIIFFDAMFFPDGAFRLVDRKTWFTERDHMFLLSREADIVLIGSGADESGGLGFPLREVNQFLYNPNTERGTQLIIKKSSEACELFNRLKREQKNVLFILHNGA